MDLGLSAVDKLEKREDWLISGGVQSIRRPMVGQILRRPKPQTEAALSSLGESNINNKKLPERHVILPGTAENSLILL